MDTVFVTIFHEYKEVLIPVILELVAESNVLVPPEDMQGILRKDAVYNAVGLCAFDLYDEVRCSFSEKIYKFYYFHNHKDKILFKNI